MHKAFLELGFESKLITIVVGKERFKRTIELMTQGFNPAIELHEAPLMSKIINKATMDFTRGRLVRLRGLLTRYLLVKVERKQGELFVDTVPYLPYPLDIVHVHVPSCFLMLTQGWRGKPITGL